MAPDLGLRLLAEAIGTALLVVFGAGTVLAALTIGGASSITRASARRHGMSYRSTWSAHWWAPGSPICSTTSWRASERVGVAAEAAQDAAGTVEGRRVAPGEDVPFGAPEDVTRTGRFQGAGGDIGRARE